MKVLIIGITGFAGVHLYQMLSEKENIELFGTYRHSVKNKDIKKKFSAATLYKCDVNNSLVLEEILNKIHPDIIFYFAAIVSVYNSFKFPISTFQTNILGTVNFLEAVRKVIPDVKILLPGSAEEYGRVAQNKMPIKESCSLEPVNPYGLSKKIQEEVGLYYFKSYDLNVYLTRSFHYTGPGQPLGFVCSDFAKQIVDFEMEKIKSIKVGNLKAKRDFTDIRDIVNAYWTIIEKGKKGEVYNVCYGNSISIEEILNKLILLFGKDIPIEIDANKFRPSDVPDFVGNNFKLKSLGWEPYYIIDDSLKELLEGWRYEIRKK